MAANHAEPFAFQEHDETVCNIRAIINDQENCYDDLVSSQRTG